MEASSKSNAAKLLVFVVIVTGSLFINFSSVSKLVVKQHYYFPNASLQSASAVRQNTLHLASLPNQTKTAASRTNSELKLLNTSALERLSPPSKIIRDDCTNYGKLKDLHLSKMTVQGLSEKVNHTLNSPFVKKKIVQGPRVVFFAGLEGTGHHLVDGSLKDVCKTFDFPSKTRCRSSSAMHSVIGGCQADWNFDKLRTPAGKEKFLRQLKNESSQTEEFVVINSLRPKNQFFNAQSYPDCGKPRINGPFPDVRLLAEYLEEVGLDFRVVVMHRQIIDSFLISITVKRKFARTFDSNIITAYQMLTNLLAQLSVIDPKFIAGCFHLDMDKEKFPQVMAKVDQALNTTLFSSKMASNFIQHSSQSCINDSQFSEEWMDRLIEKWDEMRRFCYQFVTS